MSLMNWIKKLPGWFRPPPELQAAALCYRRKDDGFEVLLIKSLGRGNWILPKGWPQKGLSLAETAAQEAFEETGAKGELSETPVGEYSYTKGVGNGGTIRCYAVAYEMEVSEMAASFPEASTRKAKWFAPEAAAKKVKFSELSDLIREFHPTDL